MRLRVNRNVIKSVKSLKYRVTIEDVAMQSRLNPNTVQKELLLLASKTHAHMQVSAENKVVYKFSPGFRQTLLINSLREKLPNTHELLLYALRVLFGISLLVWFLPTKMFIFWLIISTRDREESNERNQRKNVVFSKDICHFFELNYPRGNKHYLDKYIDEESRGHSLESNQSLSLLDAISSLVFGDGDPTVDVELSRKSLLKQVVVANRGVVVAEQIVPYLDDLGSSWDKEYENYMLPVLALLEGQPL